MFVLYFFFNDTATTEIYTLSLHDALPIWRLQREVENTTSIASSAPGNGGQPGNNTSDLPRRTSISLASDRKSTRLNSSHPSISYAVFCLKKKNIPNPDDTIPSFVSSTMAK